jgi:hypothetical protein|uniref:Methyltransferase domain-containing protein n=1 Tax=Candidatus Aramenus sulfurataquae TaxID=1326980 RepID=A0A0F2LNF3_9CREN
MSAEYFRSKGCDYWRELEPSYGCLNVRGRVVVVVGADCGSTHVYFLSRGARYVIGFEKSDDLRRVWNSVCADFHICDHGEIRGEWHGEYPDADVFVMDCEGCESNLDVSSLSKYKEWCIAVHDWTSNRVSLLRKLQGAIFSYVTDDGREIMLCHCQNVF